MHYTTIALAALASLTTAQSSPSICDKYTTALLTNNTASNQKALLTQLVNTAVIGNYVKGNKSYVPGILNPNANYKGTPVNLVKYFDGSLKSSNRGGMATSVNFLDGGGAKPLMMNMPGSDGSNQAKLLNHLYSYFGLLLGCSGVGEDGFPAYAGAASQYSVHKYMDIDENEFAYFVAQVGGSAQSFGVSMDDITAAGTALNDGFGMRCAPAATVVKAQGSQLQAICQDSSCPMASGGSCAMQTQQPSPMAASGSSMTASGSASMASSTGAASSLQVGSGLMGGVAVAAAMLL